MSDSLLASTLSFTLLLNLGFGLESRRGLSSLRADEVPGTGPRTLWTLLFYVCETRFPGGSMVKNLPAMRETQV